MMEILHEKCLTLSRKKSRIGLIEDGFHFLGIDYPPTRTGGKTTITCAKDPEHYLTSRGGVRICPGRIQERCAKHASK